MLMSTDTAGLPGLPRDWVSALLLLRRCGGNGAPPATVRRAPTAAGLPASLTARHRQFLQPTVRQQNDLSLTELESLLDEQEKVHVSTISRARSGLALPLKKSA